MDSSGFVVFPALTFGSSSVSLCVRVYLKRFLLLNDSGLLRFRVEVLVLL